MYHLPSKPLPKWHINEAYVAPSCKCVLCYLQVCLFCLCVGYAVSFWLSLRLQMIGVFIIIAAAFIAVLEHHFSFINPGTPHTPPLPSPRLPPCFHLPSLKSIPSLPLHTQTYGPACTKSTLNSPKFLLVTANRQQFLDKTVLLLQHLGITSLLSQLVHGSATRCEPKMRSVHRRFTPPKTSQQPHQNTSHISFLPVTLFR